MKKTIAAILLVCSTIGYGQYGSSFLTWEDPLKDYLDNYAFLDTVYIDPDNFGDALENGTLLHPYDSWGDFYWSGGLQSYTCYLQKRATTDTVLITYIGSTTAPVTHVKVGAYGSGPAPVVLTKKDPNPSYPKMGHKDGLFNIRGGSSYIIINDIKLTGGPGDEFGYDPVLATGISMDGQSDPNADWVTNIVISQVEIAYSVSAILLPNSVGAYVDSILIDNCIIHDALGEGMFGGRSNATVRNCSISNVSMGIKYGGEPGGDACQLFPKERDGVCGKMKYIGNFIDRSATVNKFCIIHNGLETTMNGAELYIIGNTFYPPRDTGGYFGTALYLRLADMYIYGNKFIGRGYNGDPVGDLAFIEATKNLYFVGNLADSVTGFMTWGDFNNKNQWIMNNTFSNIQRKGPTLFNLWNDSTHFRGNIFTLHGDVELLKGNAETMITSSNNITIIGDSITWADHFTEWENQDYTLKSGSSAIDGTFWSEKYFGLWESDIVDVNVPQINGYVDNNSPMDIGAFQYDDGATPLFAPIPVFSVNNETPAIGDWVTFTDESIINPAIWSWIFENGNPSISSLQNPIVTYNAPGAYNVQLTVSNSDGSNVLLKEDYINVSENNAVLLITEIMQNPDAVSDSEGEWFEVFNPNDYIIDMIGWIIEDDGSDSHTIGSSLLVPAKGFAVLGNSDVIFKNGGYSCNYVYSEINLDNFADEIVLLNPQQIEIDRVAFDGGINWPGPVGASIVFTGTATANNADFNLWEAAAVREPTFEGTNGDNGSPGINGTTQNLIPVNHSFEVQLKVFLQGPFNGSHMNVGLNTLGLLPFMQPYNSEPWYYDGNEMVPFIPNAGIVDWVIIELRDAPMASLATEETILNRKAAFLNNTGQIVDVDGESNLSIDLLVADSLFVVIHHRNHISVMSARPLILTEDMYSFDFSLGWNQYYGGKQSCTELITDVWGLISANGINDSSIDNKDKNEIWETAFGSSGYLHGDFNLNGIVEETDKTDFWKPNAGKGHRLPTN